MDLVQFLRHLDRSLDPPSILDALQELHENRTFLHEFLSRPDLQQTQRENSYRDLDTFVLGQTPAYTIRAVGWPTADESPPQRSLVYSPTIAHNHNFELFTLGYSGPGYVTKRYCVEGDSLQPMDEQKLSRGTLLHYPAFTVAHITHPPERYSISINVLIRHPEESRGNQFFDITRPPAGNP